MIFREIKSNMKINNLLNFNNKVILVTGCNGQLGNDISNFF